MSYLARWLAPAALVAALGAGALFPAPARAADDLIRVIVDVADIIYRNGHPYYRHGGYGYDNRIVVERDYRGRPVYYRYAPRHGYTPDPPYGNAYGYHRNRDNRYSRRICDSRGRCRVEYYDPRYDRRDGYRNDYGYGYGYRDRRHDRDRHDRRWRDHDDD
jgi:hypothetical protein